MTERTPADGGPAFPFVVTDIAKCQVHDEGMSLRDYFAGRALGAILADNNCLYEADGKTRCITMADNQRVGAQIAYAYADAMLAERAK